MATKFLSISSFSVHTHCWWTQDVRVALLEWVAFLHQGQCDLQESIHCDPKPVLLYRVVMTCMEQTSFLKIKFTIGIISVAQWGKEYFRTPITGETVVCDMHWGSVCSVSP